MSVTVAATIAVAIIIPVATVTSLPPVDLGGVTTPVITIVVIGEVTAPVIIAPSITVAATTTVAAVILPWCPQLSQRRFIGVHQLEVNFALILINPQ